INMDETCIFAGSTKTTTRVLYDPNLDTRPTRAYTGKKEHITMCAAISASGKMLMLVFIVKNMNITIEDCLTGSLFSCGSYGLAHSPNAWQDSVSIYLFLINTFSFSHRELFDNG